MSEDDSMHARQSAALIVFAKPPVPGQVKTRLTDLLSEKEAADLYDAFLRDALDQYRQLEADLHVYFTGLTRVPDDLKTNVSTTRVQEGEGLGARMKNAFCDVFSAGYERAVIVGTDHPSLPTAFVSRAFEALDVDGSLCIGPSEDGGYYLLGMNTFYPRVFEEMTYSRSDVFEETLTRIRETNAALTVLPLWYDVDTPDDLRRLTAELDILQGTAPRTERELKKLIASGRIAHTPC